MRITNFRPLIYEGIANETFADEKIKLLLAFYAGIRKMTLSQLKQSFENLTTYLICRKGMNDAVKSLLEAYSGKGLYVAAFRWARKFFMWPMRSQTIRSMDGMAGCMDRSRSRIRILTSWRSCLPTDGSRWSEGWWKWCCDIIDIAEQLPAPQTSWYRSGGAATSGG